MAAAAPGRRRGDRVPGLRRYRLLVVPARAIGPTGRSATWQLLVDSGAALTCLTPYAAARLELDLAPPLGYIRVSGVGSVTAPLVLLESLQVGVLLDYRATRGDLQRLMRAWGSALTPEHVAAAVRFAELYPDEILPLVEEIERAGQPGS